MQISCMRSLSVCLPQRSAQAQCHAIPHVAHFIITPRRVTHAVHTTRTYTIKKAIKDGSDPEEVLIAGIIKLFAYFYNLH